MNSKSSETAKKKVAKIRKASEKRKEKCREAARHRRSQEVEMFTEMANLLPVPKSLTSQLNQGSIMRLAIAFLKLKCLLDNSDHELFSTWNDDRCSMGDPCWSQALDGMLFVLSAEGEIIYLTENVTHQLGLPQMDLIGKSVYDYCHPNDQNELHQILSLRPNDELARSFFLRLKCDKKTVNYKVMNCSGRIVRSSTSSNVRIKHLIKRVFNQEDELLTGSHLEMENTKSPTSHFLIMVGDAILHPSNMKMPLDSDTFITNHTLDLKFNYVDETIIQFLGYKPEDLKGHSMYEFHHAEDGESVMKSYKTMFSKDQTQIPPYRFLAKYGGYVWVQTQATLISLRGCNGIIKSQVVVCVHTCLSEIEESDQVLCISQAEACAAGPV